MSLYNKHRPTTFEGMLGNKETISSLKTSVTQEDPPRAFLLCGPTGSGKTTTARIIARELGAIGDDFTEIDSADFRGIDTIRDIRRRSQFRPLEGSRRVWLIDEAHQLSRDAQNALLKALEDPPLHVFYILCTTDPQKLIPTIRSRCLSYTLGPLGELQMKRLLRGVVSAEEESLDREVYEQIILDAQGLPRGALQILEKVLSAEPDERLKMARQAAEQQSKTIELCRTLLQQRSGWKAVRDILSGLKDDDPETIRRAVLGYCSAVLLKGENDQAGLVMEEFIEPFYNTGFPGLVFACFSITHGKEPF